MNEEKSRLIKEASAKFNYDFQTAQINRMPIYESLNENESYPIPKFPPNISSYYQTPGLKEKLLLLDKVKTVNKSVPSTIGILRSHSDDPRNYASYLLRLRDKGFQNSNPTTRSKAKLTIEKSGELNTRFERKKCLKKEKVGDKIISVIQKLVEWRKLCYADCKTTELQNISKEEGTKQIRMKKKSLDEYLGITRLGIMLNFDFEANKNRKFGDLRTFVRENKKESTRWVKGSMDVEELLEKLNK